MTHAVKTRVSFRVKRPTNANAETKCRPLPGCDGECEELKSVVASLAESWNRHDMAAFAAAFAEHADFVNVIGMHWHGRQEIKAKHTVTHRTIFRSSILQMTDQAVRFLSPSIALAHVSTELKGAESLRERVAPETRRTLMTCVLVKEAHR